MKDQRKISNDKLGLKSLQYLRNYKLDNFQVVHITMPIIEFDSFLYVYCRD